MSRAWVSVWTHTFKHKECKPFCEHVLESFGTLCTQGEANPILEGSFFLQLLGQAMIETEQGPA